MVAARTDPAARPAHGISLFLVPKFLVNADGSLGARNDLRCVGIEHKLGMHAAPTCTMTMGDSGGAIGYLSANGDMDTCIALRTAVVKDGQIYIQAGGGVVADSDPEAEFQESNNKAKALIRAAEEAVKFFAGGNSR